MIRILDWNDPKVRARPETTPPEGVSDILSEVRRRGDDAVLEYEKRFGGHSGPLLLSKNDIQAAYDAIQDGALESIRAMADALRSSERALFDAINSTESGSLRRQFVPIPSVGCYVPGGQARYPSSAVMSVVPAAVAGVPHIAVATPPPADPATIVAADQCGAHRIYQTGGAQAVAALAYGTESVVAVSKIVGPGGSIVTAAKQMVSGAVQIDMDAGPTELGIVADSQADPRLVALDLISQAEHSADTFCFLLTDSPILARQVSGMIEERLKVIRRAETVRRSLYGNGFIAVCADVAGALRLAEEMAPEHLQVVTQNYAEDASHVRSPGLILMGPQTPSAASDYLLGSNHILPTGGRGRTRGPLSVLDFVKMRVALEAPPGRLARIAPQLKYMTESEGLYNHYEAVGGRLQ